MRNLLLTISYKGTNYHGFQVQKNAVTVAETLQDAMQVLFKGERPDIKGCSRTDAGVHANMFCVSFKTESEMDCDHIRRSLDALLPDDIAATDCEEVSENFHARYSCKGKRYVYKIWNAPYMSPFWQGLALHYPKHLDENFLDAVCTDFIGTYDFSAFCGSNGDQEDFTRTIFDCQMERDVDLVTFSVTGDGFLYNMVRIIVGTLMEIAYGRFSPEDVPDIIKARDRAKAGMTAPPFGLYLNKVVY